MSAEIKKHPGGRPRVHDREKLSENLLAWVEKDDAWNICGFCFDYNITYDVLADMCRNDSELGRTFQMVKAKLAQRREVLVSKGKLHPLAYAKNSRAYDPHLKMSEREEATFLASLQKQIDDGQSAKVQEKLGPLMAQLAAIQKPAT